jgi:hypothetical protein
MLARYSRDTRNTLDAVAQLFSRVERSNCCRTCGRPVADSHAIVLAGVRYHRSCVDSEQCRQR